ncbi:MAG: hypothetical protein RMN53_09035 [Anaerolineae bacterium]|nr:hypothetical protein [Anaerolineae bacterium]
MNTQPTPSLVRKPYQAPRIAYDAKLEAQAGSPIGNPFGGLLDDVTGQ